MDLPSGVVTFLMTDIEGSTRLWAEAPDAMRTALARHDAIATSMVTEHAGFLIKPRGEGDSTFSVFRRPTDAVTAAYELQAALTEERWAEGAPLRVRIAVHTGEADLGVDDYYGIAVNRCARLRSIAHGGQVLVSEATAGLVRELLPEEVGLRDLGFQRLRDLAEPERVSQLLHPSLPTDFPALRTIDLVPNNLPYQVSTFVGREAEMTKIRELLRDTRLLTLTGAGGVGKTRLALQAAAEMLYEYPDGVWLVELAALSDGGLLHEAFAAALDVREEPGRPLAETLTPWLRSKRLLLLLDNCEHLVDATANLAESLLRQCPGLRILATSRETLRTEGETVWRVPSLSVPHPKPGVRPQPEQLTQYAAVRLFIDRASKASPGFTMTNQNAPAVAEICSRLDGVPLAIELAASRTSALSPAQIERRLDERFRLLTGGRRTALPRQQTLEATVAWSFELLSDIEQRLFGRLSVFVGGFTLEAAEAVCSGAGIEEREVPELVSDLASKSLVIPGQDRYWMLETLRAYGWQLLGVRGQVEEVARRHARFFMALAEEAKPNLTGPDQADWLHRLELEHDNLRAALAWGLRHDPDGGARLATGLLGFWEIRGHWTEGRNWLRQYLGVRVDLEPGTQAEAFSTAARLGVRQGDAAQARSLAVEGLEVYRQLGDLRGEADCLTILARVASMNDDWPSSRELHGQALVIRRELGLQPDIARSLHGLALVAQEQGDLSRARLLYEEALGHYRAVGDRSALAQVLNNLGNIVHAENDRTAARALHEESLAIRRELGERAGIQMSLGNLAHIAQSEGDYTAARVMVEEALAINRELGDRRSAADGLRYLAEVASGEGRPDEARTLFLESLALSRELSARTVALDGLEGLASFESRHGQAALATRLFGAVDALRERAGRPMQSLYAARYEAQIAAARVALGEEAFAAAWAEGEAMTLEEAVAVALGEAHEVPVTR